MTIVDVVVVSFNSEENLRACVSPFADDARFEVVVVDNASDDRSLDVVANLPVRAVALEENHGFAYGCNRGWEPGSAPFVLFINPDARGEPESILRLADVLREHEEVGAVGPRIRNEDGSLDFSQRRFPRLRSTYAQALFLHRAMPRASWVDEVIRDPALYEQRRVVEWLSGACLLVRRDALEKIGGWDEGFFLYGEDVDLCLRLRTAGYRVLYEPLASTMHVGGASAPRARLLPLLARGRIRFVKKHLAGPVALLHQAGIALGSATHAALTTQGSIARAGHAQALRAAVLYDVDARNRRP
jgi:N-acetylglucosaminyl-diphospho-decaprenol L-rhamnosyltransferase